MLLVKSQACARAETNGRRANRRLGQSSMATPRDRRTLGRYDGRPARAPGDLARPPASLHVRTAVAAVPNPFDPRERIAVTTNARVDILEAERLAYVTSRGKTGISEAAYLTGRNIQAAFELSGKSSSNWCDGQGRGDPTTARELQLVHGLERAERAIQLEKDIRRIVGESGGAMVRLILGDRMSYGEVAHREGRSADYGKRQVGARFRWLLESIAEAREAKRGRGA